MSEPAFRQRLEAGGSIPPAGTEDLAQIMRADLQKYTGLVKFANMRE